MAIEGTGKDHTMHINQAMSILETVIATNGDDMCHLRPVWSI